jgi:hypothetical protein
VVSKYLDRTREWFEWLQTRAENTKNPHQQAIVKNYLTHAALELHGSWEQIFTPALTVTEPRYNIFGFGYDKLTTLSGEGEVKGFYARLSEERVSIIYPYGPIDSCLQVAEWGFVGFMADGSFMTGEEVAKIGVEVDDESAKFIAEFPMVIRWWYDSDARLIGEDIYQIGETTYTKIAPADDVTNREVRECVGRFIPT